jgi:cation diffusion facilitator CzcD-associated flavoprotein CzcO
MIPAVHFRVAIVGGGPHAMATALHLIERDPSIIESLVAFDPAGNWLATWRDQFARLDIDHLRSPGVHHPGCDPGGLSRWSAQMGMPSMLPYAIPTTAAFGGWCEHLAEAAGISELVVPERVVGLHLDDDGAGSVVPRLGDGAGPVALRLGNGTSVTADHVVLATNPGFRRIPAWAWDVAPRDPERQAHSTDVDLRHIRLPGEHVIVVGGGLTAGHLAVGATTRGARVTLVMRRGLRESMFDTDPGWLGPKNLDRFHIEGDWARRRTMALAARDGGTMPPWMTRRLRMLAHAGSLEICEHVTVCGHHPGRDDTITLVLADERRLRGDRVWLATGTEAHIDAEPLLDEVRNHRPATTVEGWPVLDDQLRWPDSTIFVTGRLATLRLGPAAGNLWGARVAASRIADAITGAHPSPRPGLLGGVRGR